MAVVEMALVGIILVFLLFGILIFGYLMSFRQNMVQAAAEGARAGAVAASGSAPGDAQSAAQQSIGGFHSCDGTALSCVAAVGTCPNAPTVTCVTVTLTYDYAHHPLLPDVPIISAFLPSTIVTTAVAEVN